MNPTGGVGALMAMHDAVALANWISTLRLPTVPQLEDVFKEYRAERYPIAKEAFERSQLFTKNLGKVCLSRRHGWFRKRERASVFNLSVCHFRFRLNV